MHVLITFLTTTLLLCASVKVSWTLSIPTETTAEIPKNSTPCSIEVEQLCSRIDEDIGGNYSIDIGTHFFKDSGELQVKVYSTSCPWHVQNSPWWYQLSVVRTSSTGEVASTEAPASNVANIYKQEELNSREGVFLLGRPNDEIQLCDSNKRVVFTTCSPTPMDFPAMFVWKSSADFNTSDTICFKLLFKQDGSTACKQIQTCRSIAQLLANTTSSFTKVSNDQKATNIALEDIIGENTVSQSSSSNMENVLDIDMSQATETTMLMSGCMSTKKFLHDSGVSWEPICDCKGHYKHIQCQKTEHDTRVCWCSSKGGSEKFNTRRTLTCSTVMDFEC